jgi:hypothetical protein
MDAASAGEELFDDVYRGLGETEIMLAHRTRAGSNPTPASSRTGSTRR